MISKEANRAALLASLRERGVQFRLTLAGMQYKDCQGTLGTEEKDWIDVVRRGLTAELRREAGLCERCGGRMTRGRDGWCRACVIEVGTPILNAIPTTKTEARRRKKNLETVIDMTASDPDATERARREI